MEPIITDVINIIEEGRRKAYKAINTSMVESYWLAGKRIVESELEGHDRAEYGKSVLRNLSIALTERFGKGYSSSYIYDFKKFYTTYPDENIFHTLCGKLTWSHNRSVSGIASLGYLERCGAVIMNTKGNPYTTYISHKEFICISPIGLDWLRFLYISFANADVGGLVNRTQTDT